MRLQTFAVFARALLTLSSIQFVPSDTDLVLTEAPMIPNSLRRVTDEQVFEEYGFRSLVCPTAAYLGLVGQKAFKPHSEFMASPCHVIVDCGYSATTISLFLDEVRLNYATLRINAGGKLLTNYLKEMISYRFVVMCTGLGLSCSALTLPFLQDNTMSQMKHRLSI